MCPMLAQRVCGIRDDSRRSHTLQGVIKRVGFEGCRRVEPMSHCPSESGSNVVDWPPPAYVSIPR